MQEKTIKPQIIKSITIGIAVGNVKEALEWYKSVLGEIEVVIPAPGMVELKLNESTWLQLDDTGYLELGSNGSTIIRLETSDIDSVFLKVKELASNVSDIEEVEGIVKYFDFKDPSGNRLSFVQLT